VGEPLEGYDEMMKMMKDWKNAKHAKFKMSGFNTEAEYGKHILQQKKDIVTNPLRALARQTEKGKSKIIYNTHAVENEIAKLREEPGFIRRFISKLPSLESINRAISHAEDFERVLSRGGAFVGTMTDSVAGGLGAAATLHLRAKLAFNKRLQELNKQIDDHHISETERLQLKRKKERLLKKWDDEEKSGLLDREDKEERDKREEELLDSKHKRGLSKEARDDEAGAFAVRVREKERRQALKQRLFELNKQIDDRRISNNERALLLEQKRHLLQKWKDDQTIMGKEDVEDRAARMGKINQATHERAMAKEERGLDTITATMKKIKLELEQLDLNDQKAVAEATRSAQQEVLKLEAQCRIMQAKFLAQEGLDIATIKSNNVHSWPNKLMRKWQAWVPENVRSGVSNFIITIGKTGLKIGTKALSKYLGLPIS
jgi:hypothetical protein